MVEYRYDVPFKFTGKIDKLTFKLEPEQDAEAKPQLQPLRTGSRHGSVIGDEECAHFPLARAPQS